MLDQNNWNRVSLPAGDPSQKVIKFQWTEETIYKYKMKWNVPHHVQQHVQF